MKKSLLFLALSLFLINTCAFAEAKKFDVKGEVVSVDPLYGRITIKHGAIKDFAPDGDTEFVLASADMVQNINKRDLVDFSVTQEKGGEATLEKITKTGEAPFREDKLEAGKALQEVLEATGQVTKTVTAPVAPVHEVVKGTVDTTTDATGAVLKDAKTEVKEKF